MLNDKDERAEKIKRAIVKLQNGGTRLENIAVKLGVSFASINSWKVGRRTPGEPTIRALESAYRIKVL